MTRHRVVKVSLLGVTVLATASLLATHQTETRAHCQVPCGIYDDAARISHMKEDAATIAKAITSINELAGKNDANALNQAVRWVTTKEAHASDIITTVSEYFLTQKVKPVAPGADGYDAYLKTLADHHAVMVAAMKTKQSADPATVPALTAAIDKLATHY
jgi:nickel superoxide dismutase